MTNLTITALNYCVEAYHCGSLNKAAKQLYISQQALSKTIANVEHSLGNAIFIRGSNGLSPTSFGKQFIQKAETVLFYHRQLELFCLSYNEGKKNTLNIALNNGGSAAYAILNIANSYRNALPSVQILFENVGSENPFDLLDKDHVDCIFTPLPVSGSEKYNCKVDSLYRFHSYVCLNSSHPKAKMKKCSLLDIQQEKLLFPRKGEPYRNALFQAFRSIGIEPLIFISTCDFEITLKSIIENNVVAILPDFLCKFMQHRGEDKVTVIPLQEPIDMEYVILSNNEINPLISSFYKYALPLFSDIFEDVFYRTNWDS